MTTMHEIGSALNGGGGLNSHPLNPVIGARTVAQESGLSDQQFSELQDLAANVLTSRLDWITKQSGLDGRRDIDKECGFPAGDLTPEDYQRLFDDDPFAQRVVEVMAKEMWQVCPYVYERESEKSFTAFEKAFNEDLAIMLRGEQSWLDSEGAHPLWEYLQRVDILSGIGRYGVILLGLNDGLPLNYPAKGIKEDGSIPSSSFSKDEIEGTSPPPVKGRLRYNLSVNQSLTTGRKLRRIQVFPEVLAPINRWESNPSSPRYGMPTHYRITFDEPVGQYSSAEGLPTRTLEVHWSRVVHIADTYETANFSDVFAAPRLRPVRRIIQDFPKILYGGAEGYWKACVNLIVMETIPQLGGNVKINRDQVRDMMEKVFNSMQRYAVGAGFTFKSIAPTVTDPTPHIEGHIAAVCIKKGIPIRVFKGSERGELASSQDDAAWNDRLKARQKTYATPRLVSPVIDRLIMLGVLPIPQSGKYRIDWPDLTRETSGEKVQVATGVADILSKYVGGGVSQVMAPMDFFTRVLWFDQEEAEAIIEGAKEYSEEQQTMDMDKREEEIDRGLTPDPQAEPEVEKDSNTEGKAPPTASAPRKKAKPPAPAVNTKKQSMKSTQSGKPRTKRTKEEG